MLAAAAGCSERIARLATQVIEIVPHQERWAREFAEIGAALRAALGPLALRIDHIGSTSVPGLAAKDVIDLQVAVASLDPIEPLVEGFMAAGGYRLRADIQGDHRPPGDTNSAEHWQKRYFREPDGGRRTHLHVRVEGRANQRYALLFRDFLRSNQLAAGGYELTKRELSRLHPDDVDAYYAVKDPVCDIIMAGAEYWAAATSWKPGASDA
ncbi:MAG: GrpB family protein [Chloroflexi bacterium]|nr:GrpB family protein [Chloroflexota bacterium]